MWTSYGYGVSHDPRIDAAVAEAAGSLGGQVPLDAPLRDLVRLEHFAVRVGEDVELVGPAAEGVLPVYPLEDPNDPPTPRDPNDDVDLVWTQQDVWADGFCWYATVTNHGVSQVVWSVEDSLPGTPDNIWSASMTELGGGLWAFSGDGWNDILDPNGFVDFGLCGTL